MNKFELRDKILDKVQDSVNCNIVDVTQLNSDELKLIFLSIYNEYPKLYNINCDWEETNKNLFDSDLIPLGEYEEINENKTFKLSTTFIGDDFIVGFHYSGLFIICLEEKFNFEYISKYLKYESTEEEPHVYWISAAQNGFRKTKLNIRESSNLDLSSNYNDDLDHNKVTSFLNGDRSGLIIFNGKCGTGKTTYIRYLAATNFDKNFLFIDSGMLSQINSSAFVDFLFDNKNSIIVLEDCETLLSSRSTGNELLKTLLNLADGVLGDGLNIKFICTFNAMISDIDQAVLRKGRMFYQYEFKYLTVDKTNKLSEKLGFPIPNKEMPLCDIYNQESNNAIKQIAKIGF